MHLRLTKTKTYNKRPSLALVDKLGIDPKEDKRFKATENLEPFKDTKRVRAACDLVTVIQQLNCEFDYEKANIVKVKESKQSVLFLFTYRERNFKILLVSK